MVVHQEDRGRQDPEELRAQVAAVLERSGIAAQLIDEHDRLVWTSPQLRAITGLTDATDLSEGRPVDGVAVEHSDWSRVIPGSAADEVAAHLKDPDVPPIWQFTMPVLLAGRQQISVLGIRLHARAGHLAGTALVFSPPLPAQILSMLSQGDPSTFERMATLAEPSARAAAVVFVDIDSSARLSRRLPTQVYFEVIRAVTTTVDRLVAERGGVVGKHAGDGASAFFLACLCGGESCAARAALSFSLAVQAAVREAVADLARGAAPVSAEECVVNVGAHWGATLYIGQVVTGGRLEVTALGDEVNEAARIEQVATGGEVLASKTLLERLRPEDADALGLNPATRTYDVLGDRAAGHDKAMRDAGTLAITNLTPDSRSTNGIAHRTS